MTFEIVLFQIMRISKADIVYECAHACMSACEYIYIYIYIYTYIYFIIEPLTPRKKHKQFLLLRNHAMACISRESLEA